MEQKEEETRTEMLSASQAQEIYCMKPKMETQMRDMAEQLAKKYGVSIKRIRDIWDGRTWYKETYHLDPDKPISLDRLETRKGRPKGSKDVKPRKTKTLPDISSFPSCTDKVPSKAPRKIPKEIKASDNDNIFDVSYPSLIDGAVVHSRKRTGSHVLESDSGGKPSTKRTLTQYTSPSFEGSTDPISTVESRKISSEDPNLSMTSGSDPFHDDWPHWDNARQNEEKIVDSDPEHRP